MRLRPVPAVRYVTPVISPRLEAALTGRYGVPCAAGLAAALLALTGCAGATMGSGVGDRFMEHPPWEAGRETVAAGRLAHLPMAWQRGASREALFDPPGGPGTPVAALVRDMNEYLATFPGSRPLQPATPAPGLPPDVMFGCEADVTGACLPWEVGRPVMRLAVARPSGDWVTWAAGAMGDAEYLLMLTLEVGQYLPRQRNLLGEKDVELGRSYRVGIPWLTSLETPVSVLQVTGVLLDRSGRAVRIGAEGLLARRTGLLASAAGLQALITDEEVARLRSERRTDLPGRPLVWQAALTHLVDGLVRGAVTRP